MNKLSPYYSYCIKGLVGSKSDSSVQLRVAAERLQKSLSVKKTEEAYAALLMCYMKLDQNELYEKTLLEASNEGFNKFYSSCGIYYANNNTKYDMEKSLFWFNKAIESGDVKAFSDLSNQYLKGCKAFGKDVAKAKETLEKGLAANDERWTGYFNWSLGSIEYELGNYESAAKHYQEAIDDGYLAASYNLALMYKKGLGVKQDLDLYIQNLLKHLSIQSAIELAGIYLTDEYATPDKEIAFAYLDYAAKNGDPVGAIMCAGFLLERKNYNEEELNRYLETAFKNGVFNQNMKDNYDAIEACLGDSVRKKLQELAAKYWEIRKNDA